MKKNQKRKKLPHEPKQDTRFKEIKKTWADGFKQLRFYFDPEMAFFEYFLSRVVSQYSGTEVTEERKMLDKVWMMQSQKVYTIEEALANHFEVASPRMFNNMDGFLYARLVLDMNAKKKVGDSTYRDLG